MVRTALIFLAIFQLHSGRTAQLDDETYTIAANESEGSGFEPQQKEAQSMAILSTVEIMEEIKVESESPTGLFGGNDETRLIQSLMSNYHGYGLTRPVKDINGVMDVKFKMIVDQFTEIDEHTGFASIVATISATWHDEFLKWNHTEPRWSRIETLLLRGRDIFMPVIIPIGSNGDKSPVFQSAGEGAGTALVWAEHTGTVHATATEAFDTICKIDVANFPFDAQECDFYFKILRFLTPRIRLILENDTTTQIEEASSQMHWKTNPMWHITAVSGREVTGKKTASGSRFNAVVYRVFTQRNAEYYLWNILLPTASMAAIQTSVFFLPFSPERVMFAVTAVLAVDIFQSSLTAKIHSSSEPMPLIKYSTAQLIMGIIITIESIFVLSITMNTGPLPPFAMRLVRWNFGCKQDITHVRRQSQLFLTRSVRRILAWRSSRQANQQRTIQSEPTAVEVEDSKDIVSVRQFSRKTRNSVMIAHALRNDRCARPWKAPPVYIVEAGENEEEVEMLNNGGTHEDSKSPPHIQEHTQAAPASDAEETVPALKEIPQLEQYTIQSGLADISGAGTQPLADGWNRGKQHGMQFRRSTHAVVDEAKCTSSKRRSVLINTNALDRHELAILVDRFFLCAICIFFSMLPVVFFKFA